MHFSLNVQAAKTAFKRSCDVLNSMRAFRLTSTEYLRLIAYYRQSFNATRLAITDYDKLVNAYPDVQNSLLYMLRRPAQQFIDVNLAEERENQLFETRLWFKQKRSSAEEFSTMLEQYKQHNKLVGTQLELFTEYSSMLKVYE